MGAGPAVSGVRPNAVSGASSFPGARPQQLAFPSMQGASLTLAPAQKLLHPILCCWPALERSDRILMIATQRICPPTDAHTLWWQPSQHQAAHGI